MNEAEFATFAGDRADAYRSLARHAGVELRDVVSAAETGDLGPFVDKAKQRRVSMLRADLESRRFAVERMELARKRNPR